MAKLYSKTFKGNYTMESLKQQGFYIENTGGGCTAWVKKMPTGQYIVLTSSSGSTHNFYGEVIVGIYDGSEDELWGNMIDSMEISLAMEEA